MNVNKRIIGFISILFASILFSCNANKEAVKKVNDGDIKILYTNDVHGAIDDNIGYAGVAALKKQVMEKYPYTILIDAGDFSQGSISSVFSKGEEIARIMNVVGYDFAVPGNHEFDYGIDQLSQNAKTLNCGMTSCNVISLKTNKFLFDGYKIFTFGNFKIGLVGVTTPDTLVTSRPSYLKENGKYIYSFNEGNEGKDLYKVVQENVNKVRKEGADYVILVGHLGEEGVRERWSGKEVIKNINGIDALIDGHSHEFFDDKATDKDGKEVLLLQTGTKLKHVGLLTIDKDGNFSNVMIDRVMDSDGNDIKDEATTKTIEEEKKKFNDALERKIMHIDFDLTIVDDAGNRIIRNQETNLANLCTDALLNGLEGAECAILGGGSIRDTIKAGDVTYGDIVKVFPFCNMCSLVKLKGSNIRDALEMGARKNPEENGGFLHVAGISYTIDTTINSTVELDEAGSFASVSGDRRIKDVMINGEPLDDEKYYKVAGISFNLKDGGDGFKMLTNSEILLDDYCVDTDALASYIISCDLNKYKNKAGEGRITILK